MRVASAFRETVTPAEDHTLAVGNIRGISAQYLRGIHDETEIRRASLVWATGRHGHEGAVMKPFDPTTRCRNCGGIRSEHRINGLHSCPKTRADKGYWTPWTVEEYEQSELARAHPLTQEDMERARLYELMRKH